MFSNVFKYSLLLMVRQKVVLFWSLAFPILMSILFTMAFGNLYSGEVIREEIPLAYVAAEQPNPMYDLQRILADIPRGKGEQKLFRLEETDEDGARALVRDQKVAAAVLDGQQPELLVARMDLKQVITKQVLDQVAATRNTMVSLISLNPMNALKNLPEQLSAGSYIRQQSLGKDRMTPDIMHFFALLAMASLSAVTAGAALLIRQQADKSPEGARSSAASLNKWARVAAAGLAGYLVQLILTLVVYGFMRFVLQKNFGSQEPFVLLVIALGTMAGFLMGMALACMMRGSERVIIGATVGAYLFSSFLTGLMGSSIKRLVDTMLPWLAAVNPGSMIVDALYSLYYYQAPDYRYLLYLSLVCLFFAGIAALTLRRRYHDSI